MSGNIIGFGWEIRKKAFWKLSILHLICCPEIILTTLSDRSLTVFPVILTKAYRCNISELSPNGKANNCYYDVAMPTGFMTKPHGMSLPLIGLNSNEIRQDRIKMVQLYASCWKLWITQHSQLSRQNNTRSLRSVILIMTILLYILKSFLPTGEVYLFFPAFSCFSSFSW